MSICCFHITVFQNDISEKVILQNRIVKLMVLSKGTVYSKH